MKKGGNILHWGRGPGGQVGGSRGGGSTWCNGFYWGGGMRGILQGAQTQGWKVRITARAKP